MAIFMLYSIYSKFEYHRKGEIKHLKIRKSGQFSKWCSIKLIAIKNKLLKKR